MRNATRSNNTCPADENPLLVPVMRIELCCCCFDRLVVGDEDMLMLLACRIRCNQIEVDTEAGSEAALEA